ncbi:MULTISPECIES: LexA family protein [Acinetobacter]|uniref:LexA family protein n=1 Tax=Acinetobacter TaxID=469 RepID=UPI00214F8FD5|nr:translesion error-prone DNA polymerase V autoproteolytic subunit [Acinetobacter venetianus]MCR4529800.1 translesion error-prone DNA polymerase V autoproteolytic subunit [Acinetobacter venetianus]
MNDILRHKVKDRIIGDIYHHSLTRIDPKTLMAIPVAEERLSAGFPSPAQDYVDKSIDMNLHLIANPTATFIAKVNSSSMRNIGIDIDDEVIVDRSLEAKHRDIVLALIDNDFTLKRLMIEDERRWLKAENPEYPNIYFNDGQELIIWGVVTRCIKKFR